MSADSILNEARRLPIGAIKTVRAHGIDQDRLQHVAPTMTHGKRVATKLKRIALVAESQNWNSGRRRMKGLNSSSLSSLPPGLGLVVGSPGAPSSTSCSARSCSKEGSNFGVKKAKKRSMKVNEMIGNRRAGRGEGRERA